MGLGRTSVVGKWTEPRVGDDYAVTRFQALAVVGTDNAVRRRLQDSGG